MVVNEEISKRSLRELLLLLVERIVGRKGEEGEERWLLNEYNETV
jgi:hypothetical protein